MDLKELKEMLRIEFANVKFDALAHAYSINGEPLISATQLTSTVEQPFDREMISMRSAAKEGVSQNEILQRWEKNRLLSIVKGNEVHKIAQDILTNNDDPLVANNPDIRPEVIAVRKAITYMRENFKMIYVDGEVSIGDQEWGIGGKPDAIVMLTIDGQTMPHIVDWKTGKLETYNQYEQMMEPFDRYSSCKLNKYSLQTSIYKAILSKHGFKTGNSYLVHCKDDEDFTIHRCEDMSDYFVELYGSRGRWWVDEAGERSASAVIKVLRKLTKHKLLESSKRKIIAEIKEYEKWLMKSYPNDEPD